MRGERLLFSGLGFDVGAGDLLTLTGRNGAGKSTLIRMIAGLVRPFAGQLLWRGAKAHDDREAFAADCVYAGHRDGLKTALTARENLDMIGRLTGQRLLPPVEALDRFGIADLAELPVGYLSAGQRRRVALARLVMTDAPLWLLDEPLTAIDRASIAVLGRVMRDHLESGGLIVAATHAPLPEVEGAVLEITPPETDAWDDDGAGDAPC
jgi:heme exporter protein A